MVACIWRHTGIGSRGGGERGAWEGSILKGEVREMQSNLVQQTKHFRI
jgi:hypothetical protein